MKKIFSILILALTVSKLFAQTTTPRFQADRYTKSVLTDYKVATDTTGNDTVLLKPQAGKTLVKVSVVDSVTFKFSSVSNSYFGDEVVIIATNASGSSHRVKVASTNAQPASSGDVTLASTLGAIIRYIFNGVKWVEASRAVQ